MGYQYCVRGNKGTSLLCEGHSGGRITVWEGSNRALLLCRAKKRNCVWAQRKDYYCLGNNYCGSITVLVKIMGYYYISVQLKGRHY